MSKCTTKEKKEYISTTTIIIQIKELSNITNDMQAYKKFRRFNHEKARILEEKKEANLVEELVNHGLASWHKCVNEYSNDWVGNQ